MRKNKNSYGSRLEIKIIAAHWYGLRQIQLKNQDIYDSEVRIKAKRLLS